MLTRVLNTSEQNIQYGDLLLVGSFIYLVNYYYDHPVIC